MSITVYSTQCSVALPRRRRDHDKCVTTPEGGGFKWPLEVEEEEEEEEEEGEEELEVYMYTSSPSPFSLSVVPSYSHHVKPPLTSPPFP